MLVAKPTLAATTALLPPETVQLYEDPTVPAQLGVTAVPLTVTTEKTSPAAWPLTTPWVTVADVDACGSRCRHTSP